MARETIHAAGGIVVRGGARPLVAVVQRSKDERWVLPRGKLKRDENPLAGARREAVEETGHRVKVHEFLGAITYTVRGEPKVVQFWRMQAAAQPSHDLNKDIVAVEWLPLAAAVRRLSFVLEKLFLLNVGRRALKHGRRGARRRPQAKPRPRRRSPAKRAAKRALKRPAKKVAKRSVKRTARRSRAMRARKLRPQPHKSYRAASRHGAHIRAAQAPAQPAERRSMLQRMFGRLGR